MGRPRVLYAACRQRTASWGIAPDNIAIHERRRDMLELRQEAVKTMALPACVCGINEFHTIL